MTYFAFQKINKGVIPPEEIESLYNSGYVCTREEKGAFNQVRSVRIPLSSFVLQSENKRILKKMTVFDMHTESIPYEKYTWHIGKMAKDFYLSRGAEFSANKIKELLTDTNKSNFNTVLVYNTTDELGDTHTIGYAICLETEHIMHYSYPFYDFVHEPKDTGMKMLLSAILYAEKKKKKYIYIGSLSRPNDTYKLQFTPMEWFTGKAWSGDIAEAKEILRT